MLQLLKAIQYGVRHRQDVGRVVDGLHTAEDGEGEQGDHQEIWERQRARPNLLSGGKDQPHGRRPQSKQVQAVPGHEAELVLDPDGFIGPAGIPEPLDGYPFLADGLHYRQAVDVLDGRAGQRLLGAVAHWGGAGALPPNAPQGKGGYQDAGQRHQSRRRAEDGHAQQDYRHLDIAVDHRVHHLHALKFQRAQLRGEGGQDVPQVVPCEVP